MGFQSAALLRGYFEMPGYGEGYAGGTAVRRSGWAENHAQARYQKMMRDEKPKVDASEKYAAAFTGFGLATSIIGGYIAAGASKVEAKFAELAAYQQGSDIASELNVALASQVVGGRASGFASTGGALMDADRTRAAQDIEAARYQGFLESNALKHKARAQVVAGYAEAAQTAGRIFAAGA